MAVSFDISGKFFGAPGFANTATIGSSTTAVNVVRMMMDDSRQVLAAGESDEVDFSILVKTADASPSVGDTVVFGGSTYRIKTLHRDGANLTYRLGLSERYG